MSDSDRPARRVWRLIAGHGLLTRRLRVEIAAYLATTPLTVLLDGLVWVLLMHTFLGPAGAVPVASEGLDKLIRLLGWPEEQGPRLAWLAALFSARAVLAVALAWLEAAAQAHLREDLQVELVERLFRGDWEELRSGSVGRWVSAITEEAAIFSKLALSVVRAVYFLAAFLALGLMALWIAPRLTLSIAALGVPGWVLLRWLYRKQSGASGLHTAAKQAFASDLAERLVGLYQVKASGDSEFQQAAALRELAPLGRMEILVGFNFGLITSFNLLMLPVLLGAYGLVRVAAGESAALDPALLGTVGILGYRAAGQLNNLVSALGNLTRLSGCIDPVERLAAVPPAPERAPIPEPLAAIRLKETAYRYPGKPRLAWPNRELTPGRITLITGPSGIGKTTLANLLAGLLRPTDGGIEYVGASGRAYASTEHRARIGFVPQDVHLFRGTARENVDPGGRLSDERVWDALERTEAAGFVRALGGLGASVSEAGRSLSGGEKRRLAMAAALAQDAQALLLDEVTSGLDADSKAPLLRTVAGLAKDRIVVAISHDLEGFQGIEHERWTLEERLAVGGAG